MSRESKANLRARKAREKRRRHERFAAGEAQIEHGSLSSYNNWGCRCGPCTAAYMEWYWPYASRRKPSRKKLPPKLAELCESVSPEVAALIQEQYDDDQGRRVGYGVRFDGNPQAEAA